MKTRKYLPRFGPILLLVFLFAACQQSPKTPALYASFHPVNNSDTLRLELPSDEEPETPGDTIPNALFFSSLDTTWLRAIEHIADSSEATVVGRGRFPLSDGFDACLVDLRQFWFKHQSLLVFDKNKNVFTDLVTVAEWYGGEGGQILTGSWLFDYNGIGWTQYALGVTNSKTRNFQKAIDYFQQSLITIQYEGLPSLDKMIDQNLLQSILENQSRCYLNWYLETGRNQLLQEANKSASEATVIFQNKLKKTLDTESKILFANQGKTTYEAALVSGVQQFQKNHDLQVFSNCFTFAELSKAIVMFQNMKETEALHFAQIPKLLQKEERQIRLDIADLDKKHQQLSASGFLESDTTVLKISSRLFDLRQEYEALKLRLEKDYPDYYRLKYDLSTASLAYVQDSLLQPGQTLLEYFTGDSSSYIFLVQKDRHEVLEVKTEKPLKAWVAQLQEGLYAKHTDGKAQLTDAAYRSSLDNYLPAARFLYEKLIAPVKDKLTPEVIIVPDGVLNNVPFEALLTQDPERPDRPHTWHFLLNDHDINYCYSATLLREMRQKQHRRQPKNELLAFAPFFDGDTTLLGNLFEHDLTLRKDLQPLPDSGEEAFGAAKIMGGKAVLAAGATEENFIRQAGDYRLLHLATHGKANRSAGDYSFLVFTEIEDSLENELLYVRDLYNLSLNADLVMLSACETGAGQLQTGEGIISLARAFAYAGAKSMVTTLWSVGDRHSKDLTLSFYKSLKKGMRKDEALRQAKRDFIGKNKGTQAHPFYWAGFVAIGDMGALW
jgi:CHAT domain-containing protein